MPRKAVQDTIEKRLSGEVIPIWFDDPGLSSCLDSVVALITRTHDVGTEQLSRFPNLKMVSGAFTGFDRVSVGDCNDRGVAVYVVPGYSTQSVAELAVLFALAHLRRVFLADTNTRAGHWDTGGVLPGAELASKTVGIIGTGEIGSLTARLFLAFGCRVIAWNRHTRAELADSGVEFMESPEELLAHADVISLHLALNDDTSGFLSPSRLSLMSANAFLINCARSELVDSTALLDALQKGRIGGAGIDVFEQDPVDPGNKLLKLPNVILTPHIGYKTREALTTLVERSVENIARFQNDDATNLLVKPPQPFDHW